MRQHKKSLDIVKTIRISAYVQDLLKKVVEADAKKINAQYHNSEMLYIRMAISKQLIADMKQQGDNENVCD